MFPHRLRDTLHKDLSLVSKIPEDYPCAYLHRQYIPLRVITEANFTNISISKTDSNNRYFINKEHFCFLPFSLHSLKCIFR